MVGTSPLQSLCEMVEPSGSLHRMPLRAAEVGMIFYAHCVSFCDRGGFPYSSIRVELFSGGDPVYRASRKIEATTTLSFHGNDWKALRQDRAFAQGAVAKTSSSLSAPKGSAWLQLDSPPDRKLFSFSKERNATTEQDEYRLPTATWIFPPTGDLYHLIDPWEPTKKGTVWHPRALTTLKKGKEAEVARVLDQAQSHLLSQKDREQLREAVVRRNEQYTSFSDATKKRIDLILGPYNPPEYTFPSFSGGYYAPTYLPPSPRYFLPMREEEDITVTYNFGDDEW